jgi:hypothetical protein
MSTISPSAGEQISSLNFYNPTTMLLRRAERSAYETTDWFRTYLAGNAGAYGAPLTDEDLHVPSPTISPEDAIKKYPMPEGQKPLFDQPLPDRLAQQIHKTQMDKIEADSNIQRFDNTHSWPTRLAVGFVADIMDPINDAAMFIPGLGEEAVAARLGLTGAGFLGRTVTRAVSGATYGIASSAPVNALRYGLSASEGTDYDIRRALVDTFISAPLGAAALLSATGAAGDVLKYAFGKREAEAIANADATTHDAANRTAVSQVVSGRPVDVDGFYPKPPLRSAETAVGRFLDNPYLTPDITVTPDQLNLNRDAVARQLEPKLFQAFDDLNSKKQALAAQYQEMVRSQASPEGQAANEVQAQINDLKGQLETARPRNKAKLQERVDELEKQVTATSESEIAALQKEMQDTDFAQRDMAAKVSDVYKRADESIARISLAETGARAEEAQAQQRSFVRPSWEMTDERGHRIVYDRLKEMVDRQRAWNQSGIAPGMTQEQLAAATKDVADSVASAKPAPEPEKMPEGFGDPAQPFAATAPTKPKEIDISGMGSAISDNFYADLYSALGGAKNAVAKNERNLLARLQPEFDAGNIKGPQDVRKLAEQYYSSVKTAKAQPKPAEPAIDTTGWHPEDVAELQAASKDVEKAETLKDAYDEAAMCIKSGGG